MPTDPHHNRSGLSPFLLLQGVEYGDSRGAGLFFFGTSDKPDGSLFGCAFLAVADELLQLLGP
jgi:hypothetical protein